MGWFAQLLGGNKNKSPQWRDIEYFHDTWKLRIASMAKYIPANSTVIDLGSGKEWLREFLPQNCHYVAVDYLDRGTKNLVCDFNKKEFPNIKGDIAFISGCLEYIENPNWFIEQVSQSNSKIILSYNTTEMVSNIIERNQLAWKNHLSEKELIELFKVNGLELKNVDRSVTKNVIFIFERMLK